MVQRELRVGASRGFNYWLRVAAGAVALLILYFATETSSFNPSAMGSEIFASLHTLVVVMLLVTIPAMTADCIAREKREGTLGLLFMTPLSAEGIVIGKCCVQVLRAWCLWLSILPVLTVPFLLGGVTWTNLLAAILIELCVAFLALAAGLLIASTTKIRVLAIILAEITALIFVYLFGGGLSIYFSYKFGGPGRFSFGSFASEIWMLIVQLPSQMSGLTSVSPKTILWPFGKSLFCIILLAFLCIRITAWHIKQTWRDKAPSRRQQWWLKRFCTELRQDAFHRKMQRTLDWNPIAFLQQYSWKNRLSKWGLCLLFVIVQSGFCNQLGSTDFIEQIQIWLLLILAAMFTFIGVSSFLTEKQNGALELILITPLKVNQIILGRSWGLWKQFLPALLSLLLFQVAAFWASSRSMWFDYFLNDIIFLMGFLSLPFFATYAALRVRWMLGAALLTWIGILLGLAFGFALASFLTNGNFSMSREPYLLTFCIGISYAAFVGLTFFLLRHSLSRRIYSF